MTTQKGLVYLTSHLVITRMNINVISLMNFTGPVHFYQCTVNAITEITWIVGYMLISICNTLCRINFKWLKENVSISFILGKYGKNHSLIRSSIDQYGWKSQIDYYVTTPGEKWYNIKPFLPLWHEGRNTD